MALQKTLSLKNNFGEDSVFPDAYLRVDGLTGNKRNMYVTVGVYKQKDGASIATLQHGSFTVALDGDNFIAQAYAFLKTLPDFEGAVDC